MTRRLSVVIACVLPTMVFSAASGCKKKESNTGSAEKKTEMSKARKARPSKPLKELFTSKGPVLPGPYAKLKFGMTKQEAKKTAPGVFGGDLGRIKSDEYADVIYHEPYFDRKTKGLKSITLYLPPDKARGVVTEAWGKPTEIKDRGKSVFLWFNPKDRIRASLRPFNSGKMALDLHPYVPVREFLGEGKKFAFETKPLIGIPVDDVKKNYPKRFYRKGKYTVDLKFPPMEYDFAYGLVDRTMVEVAHKDGKTTGFKFRLSFKTYPAAKPVLFGLLKKKFGEPKKQKHSYTGRISWLFSASPPVKVTDSKRFWYILVGKD